MSEATPNFLCKLGDDQEKEWHPISAWDAESAAEAYGEYVYANKDGWEYMSNRETEIMVKSIETNEVKSFMVTTEFQPHFSATEKSP